MAASSYTAECRKCRQTVRRYLTDAERYDLYEMGSGYHCPACGTPNMKLMRSNISAKDAWQPGIQRHLPPDEDGNYPNITCRKKYFDYLREHGLREVGTEYESAYGGDLFKKLPPAWTEDGVKKAIENGIIGSDEGVLINYLMSQERQKKIVEIIKKNKLMEKQEEERAKQALDTTPAIGQ